jgi:hypothetical protein
MKRYLVLLVPFLCSLAFGQGMVIGPKTVIVPNTVLSPGSVPAPTLRQAAVQATGFSSYTVALGSSASLGDTILAFGAWTNQTATLTSFATTGCTTGTWTYVNNPTHLSTTQTFVQGYATVSSAGTCTLTMTLSASSFTAGIAMMDCANCGAFDVSAAQGQSSPGTGANAVSSGNMSATAGDFIGCGVFSLGNGSTSGLTAGTGFTGSPASQFYDGSGDSIYNEYLVPASGGSVAGTFTTTVSFQSFLTGCMAFK